MEFEEIEEDFQDIDYGGGGAMDYGFTIETEGGAEGAGQKKGRAKKEPREPKAPKEPKGEPRNENAITCLIVIRQSRRFARLIMRCFVLFSPRTSDGHF